MRSFFAVSALVGYASAADQDCLVTPWTAYAACSATCGGGSHVRSRSVSVKADGSGAACPVLTQSSACNTLSCASVGTCELTEWAAWSACSQTCFDGKTSGVQTRTRGVTSAEGSCVNPTLTEERVCNSKVQCNCVLGDWQPWNACSKSCDGGVMTREKAIVKEAAAGHGMCNLDILEGRQRKACNAQKCPVASPVALAKYAPYVRLEGQSQDLAITGDATHLYSGASQLESVTRNNMRRAEARALSAPYTTITALANDDTHVFCAVKGQVGSELKVGIEKIRKADMSKESARELTWLSTSADFGAVIAIVQDADNLYVSLGSASNNAALLTISKATMQTTATGTLSGVGEANALTLGTAGLTFGTWLGQLGTVATTDVASLSMSDVYGDIAKPVVGAVETAHGIFFSTDPPAGQKGEVAKFLRADWTALANAPQRPQGTVSQPIKVGSLDADGDKCTALLADSERLYCGTNNGKVETFSQDTLVSAAAALDMAQADPTGQSPAFYAGVALDSQMYLASYAGSSTIYNVDGFMKPQDCKLSPWSEWGACVNPSPLNTRPLLTCGTGGQFRKRAVLEQPKWGGAACGSTEDVQSCSVKDANDDVVQCCKGGMVHTTVEQTVTCAAGAAGVLGTPITHAQSTCRCPAPRPVAITNGQVTVCGSIDKDCTSQMAAKVCEHISCAFLPQANGEDRIVVRHTGAPNEQAPWGAAHSDKTKVEGLVKHQCTHSQGRMGGCQCLCWKNLMANAV